MRPLKDLSVLKSLVRQGVELENTWFGFRKSSAIQSEASGIKLAGLSATSPWEILGIILIPTSWVCL